MTLVTVGNATQHFHRLVNAICLLSVDGVLAGEEVVIQSGHSVAAVVGKCTIEPFMSPQRYHDMIMKSDLIICHAGVGTLIHVFNAGKVPVVMPRLKKFGEHVDDHQLELVKMLADERRVVPAYRDTDLSTCIEEARRRMVEKHPRTAPPLIELVREAIEDLRGKAK